MGYIKRQRSLIIMGLTVRPILGNKSSESDIDGLTIFKFYEHPEPRIRTQIEVMKPEFMRYQALVVSSSHSRKGRIGRARTHSTCLIGGSQTVQRYWDSRTCDVQ